MPSGIKGAGTGRTGRNQLEPTRADRPITAAEKKHCISIYDREDADSVWSRCSDRLRGSIDSIPAYLKTWSEDALEKKVRDGINTRDRQLRMSFWREYNYALDNDCMMASSQIIRGICTKEYWYRYVTKDSKKFAWILFPPADYEASLEEILNESVRGLREIVTAPIYDKDGKPIPSVMNAKLKAHEMIENRVKGVNPQKFSVEQKTLSLNLSGKTDDKLSPAELDAELRRLESKIKKLPQPESQNATETVIDVTTKPSEEHG